MVDKPVGWHCVRGTTDPDSEGRGVLSVWLEHVDCELAKLPDKGLVHRLDRDTSGCVLVARTAAAHQALSSHLRNGRNVRKWYLARLAPGISDDGDATLYFTSRYRRSARITVSRTGDARHAGRFRWHLRERDGARGDLVEIELVGAGKRHEIRAGCAHLGHPLMGDALYGGAPGAHHQLHAWRIELYGELVEAPLPPWARC